MRFLFASMCMVKMFSSWYQVCCQLDGSMFLIVIVMKYLDIDIVDHFCKIGIALNAIVSFVHFHSHIYSNLDVIDIVDPFCKIGIALNAIASFVLFHSHKYSNMDIDIVYHFCKIGNRTKCNRVFCALSII